MPSGTETIYASTATTATHSKEFGNVNVRGCMLIVDVSAAADTPSVTPSMQVRDGNGDWNDIWTAAAAFTGTGTKTYLLYPGAANGNFTEVDGIPLPVDGRFTFTHADADSITYSVLVQWLK